MNELSLERINELARKQKSPAGLTPEEKEEQAKLRKAYLAAIRRNLRGQLETVDIVNPDGSVTSLKEEHERRIRTGEIKPDKDEV